MLKRRLPGRIRTHNRGDHGDKVDHSFKEKRLTDVCPIIRGIKTHRLGYVSRIRFEYQGLPLRTGIPILSELS